MSVVSEVLETVAGNRVVIKDTFRLEKKQQSRPTGSQLQSASSASASDAIHTTRTSEPARPRPILVKLNCPWHRRIILAGKKKLSSIEGKENYFLQPDLSLDERKKHRAAYLKVW